MAGGLKYLTAKRFKVEAQKLLKEQLKRIKGNIKQEVSKALDGFTFDDDAADADFIRHLTPLEYELLKEQGAIALALAGADELEFQVNEKVKKEVLDRISRMARNFNDQTKAALIKSITEGVLANETIRDITKRIESIYSDAMGYRAERIAKTETLNASNAAAQEAYLQTGFITKEEWFANPTACEFCAEMDGKVISISQNFLSQGQTLTGAEGGELSIDYTDIGYPPLHPNCTCSVIPVTEN